MSNSSDELGVLGKELDGRYRIDALIGAGAMGAVYAGTQLAVGRRVAIKLLNAALQSQHEVRERFRVEAQAIAKLNHPNSVTLFDFGYSEELAALYMVVEYLDGQPLDKLARAGLQPATALSLAKQIADVLVVAHEAGITHRDLKPENVMVIEGKDGALQAKVLDFGLARIFEDSSGSARLTRHGQLFGTPAYMSPEQCHSAMVVGPESDVYSLGISLFEMLSARLPFESPSVPELLVLHSTKTAPPLATSAQVPLEVNALVARMLSKHPADRPTAAQTSAILAAAIDGRPIPALGPIVARTEIAAELPTVPPSPELRPTVMTSLPAAAAAQPAQAFAPKTVDRRANTGGIVALIVLLLIGIGAAVWTIKAKARRTHKADTPAVAVVEPPLTPVTAGEPEELPDPAHAIAIAEVSKAQRLALKAANRPTHAAPRTTVSDAHTDDPTTTTGAEIDIRAVGNAAATAAAERAAKSRATRRANKQRSEEFLNSLKKGGRRSK